MKRCLVLLLLILNVFFSVAMEKKRDRSSEPSDTSTCLEQDEAA